VSITSSFVALLRKVLAGITSLEGIRSSRCSLKARGCQSRVVKIVRDAVANKEVCTSCVQSVFLAVRGNDAQNIRSEKGLKKFESSYKKLIELINSKFPVIRINVVSLVPRRTTNYWHVQRFFHINDFLHNLCSNENFNISIIPVFTKFVVKKDLYYHSGQVIMSSKLFLKDGIHFTRIGDSVLFTM
jgi:hypothetical protein